ncbi:MAG TPA: WD40 repeat domain-containing protein [Oscillatoriaceae cyanobacterium M33_DOE_052]|uniref:WD40 repeat domain-containing protein n=1 Tax=Planktothricoides sp. SpSt-374 TaxID=2282167 RepID=A0A7C3VP51_9CYAN|nr:WD40 repeat domain-containing protein [Oscillatoriaceae cyanobacterium M33_DOE_052]
MTNQPKIYDAVLGGDNPPPVTAAVLGGIAGVKRRFAAKAIEEKRAALKEAVNYPHKGGLDILIQALKDPDSIIQKYAYFLLKDREEVEVKAALIDFNIYQLFTCKKTVKGHIHSINSIAFSPTESKLASCGNDGTIKIWDGKLGTEIKTLTGHTGMVYDLAWTPDGKRLASGGYDGTVKIWDVQSGTLLGALTGHTGKVLGVAVAPGGSGIASCSEDKSIKIWDMNNGTLLHTLRGHAGMVQSVAYSDEGRQLISGSEDGTIKIWDIGSDTGSRPEPIGLRSVGVRVRRTLRGHDRSVTSIAIAPINAPSSLPLVASGSWDGYIKIWDAHTGELKRTLTNHNDWVTGVTISADGRTLVSCSCDRTIKIIDIATGTLRKTLRGHTQRVSGVAISPDGKTIASCSRDSTIKIWGIGS